MLKCIWLALVVSVPSLVVKAQRAAELLPVNSHALFLQPRKNNAVLRSAIIDSLNARSEAATNLFQQNAALNGMNGLNRAVSAQFYDHISKIYGEKKLKYLKQGHALLKDTSRLTKYLDEKLRGFYALKNVSDVRDLMKKKALANKFKMLTGTAFYDNSPGAASSSGFVINFEDDVVVGNIPVNIIYTNVSGLTSPGRDMLDQQLKKFSFDRKAYLERMNGYLNKNYDLKKYFLSDIDVASAVKSFAAKQIKSVQDDMGQMLDAQKAAVFKNLISAEQLVYLDSAQITHLLLDNAVLQLNATELQGQLPDTALLVTNLHGKTVLAARHYIESITRLKASINEGLAAKETFTSQHQLDATIKERINNPEAQKRNIEELLPLNFLQRMLLQAKSFNIGNIAASGSKGGVQDLFMSGIQGSFLNKNKYLMLGLGTTRSNGDLKDLNYNSALDPGAYSVQFLQMGRGDIAEAHSHVAVVNANTKSTTYGRFSAAGLNRNIFVGAFSEKISLGTYGVITAEMSKSNNEFSNSAAGNSYALASKTAAFTLLNDFWQTISAGLDYAGELRRMNMSQRVYFNYTGLGYTNPASPGGSRGTLRYGINVKRDWNKRKVTVGFRTDVQDINTSAIASGGWKNRQYAVDTRIKVRRNVSLSARLGQSVMKGFSGGFSHTAYFNRQVSISSQVSGKLCSLSQSNNMSLGLQQLDIPPLKSVLVNVNMNHSVVVNTHILSVAFFYNKDLRGQALYGNLLTAETGWSYRLGKIWSCSSGLNYLDNKDVVRQIGIRQTISAELLKKLQVNLYADCRKQLLNTPGNYLFGSFNTQLSFNYQLNR